MEATFIWAQIFGVIGFITAFLTFQYKERTPLLTMQSVNSIAFAIHWALLGAWTGVGIAIINVFRNYAFEKNWKNSLLIFCLIYLINGIFTWEGWHSLLATVAILFGTYRFWVPTARQIRNATFIASPLWFVYNFVVESYGGMATNIVIFLSALTGKLRHDKHVKE